MELPTVVDLIGTPRFPLNDPKRKRIFTREGARPIDAPVLADVIRAVHKRTPFGSGFCYSTTRKVVENARGNGVGGVNPWAGWLIIGGVPVHHAWVVYQREQVIDLTSIRNIDDIDDQCREKWAKIGDAREVEALALADPEDRKNLWINFEVEKRKDLAAICAPFEAGDVIDNRIWGVPPRNFIYVGCPADPGAAKRLYRQWHAKYGMSAYQDGLEHASVGQLLGMGREDLARARLKERADEMEQEG